MIFWEDVQHPEADRCEPAALESEAAAFAHMTPEEQAADRAYQRAKRQAARAEWAGRWPAYCHRCEGHGAHTVIGGSGDEPEYEGEMCDHCSGRDRCPRCGSGGFRFFDPGGCHCGWTYGTPESAMPPELLEGGATDLNDYLDPFRDD